MADQRLGAVLRRMRVITDARTESIPDDQLVDRFVNHGDGTAFATLVQRHGPMVRSVCQRELRDLNDVDDAFQATFLVFVRKANTLGQRERVAGWLHGVALRIARKARVQSVRRHAAQKPLPELAVPSHLGNLAWRDLRPVLDQEIERLPSKYREPFVLCYLEGLTYSAAAQHLKVPPGTVCGRLDRARDLLRARLARRGLTLTTSMLGALLSKNAVSAGIPPLLLHATIEASLSFGGLGAGAVSGKAILLAHAVLRSLLWSKMKYVACLVIASLAILGGGLGASLATHAPPTTARAVPGNSQEHPVPVKPSPVTAAGAAQKIVERALLGLGGKEKVASLKSASWTTVSKPTKDTERTQRITAHGYDCYRTESEHLVNGEPMTLLYVLNRTTGWRREGRGAVAEFPQTAVSSSRENFYALRVGELLTLLSEKDLVLTSTGPRKIGRRQLTGIRVEKKGYPTSHLFFDLDTGLLHRSESNLSPRADGTRSLLSYTFEDYREFQGLKHATRIISKVDEQPETSWLIRDFRVLETIDPHLFEKP